MFALVPALVAVVIFKILSLKVVEVRNIDDPSIWGQLKQYIGGNGVMICLVIWGYCGYKVIRHIYDWRRDRPVDKTLLFVPLGFYCLLIAFLVIQLLVRFEKGDIEPINEIAELAVFMPVMGALGMVFFAWPYLDAIFRRR